MQLLLFAVALLLQQPFSKGRRGSARMMRKHKKRSQWVNGDDVMDCPSTPDDWKRVELGFDKRWNFKHTCGAVDGKHAILVSVPVPLIFLIVQDGILLQPFLKVPLLLPGEGVGHNLPPASLTTNGASASDAVSDTGERAALVPSNEAVKDGVVVGTYTPTLVSSSRGLSSRATASCTITSCGIISCHSSWVGNTCMADMLPFWCHHGNTSLLSKKLSSYE